MHDGRGEAQKRGMGRSSFSGKERRRLTVLPSLMRAMVPRSMMNLSSSFDRQVVDGQQAAEFVQALRRYLVCPALLFVD
jgi:pyruvate/2-oxoglutarate dehydrogenase complex dihydrolipoamide acyltransferase (E2) component